MKLVQVTLLSETDFGFQSKHIHLMKYCEYACAVILKFRNFGRCRKRKWFVMWHYQSFGCCRKI